MASLITCTPGGATDNSYLTDAQATALLASTLREYTWAQYAVAERERALIQATAEIEALGGSKLHASYPTRRLFIGGPYSTTQALHFPRAGDTTSAGAAVIIDPIKRAVLEQALYLLERHNAPPLLDRDALRDQGVTSVSMDGISESYAAIETPRGIAPAAWQHIRIYVRRTWGTV
jgi:hypothetical protein